MSTLQLLHDIMVFRFETLISYCPLCNVMQDYVTEHSILQKPVGHCLLLIAHWLLLVAYCLLVKSGGTTHTFFVFPVSNAKDSQSMIITVIIGHLPNRCSSTTTRHYVLTAHPNSVHINIIFVRLHTSLFFCSLPYHNFCTYTLKEEIFSGSKFYRFHTLKNFRS